MSRPIFRLSSEEDLRSARFWKRIFLATACVVGLVGADLFWQKLQDTATYQIQACTHDNGKTIDYFKIPVPGPFGVRYEKVYPDDVDFPALSVDLQPGEDFIYTKIPPPKSKDGSV